MALPRSSDIGTLYVLTNRDRSLAKIGLTRLGTPQQRALSYGHAHGIEWFTYWSAPTRDVAKVEVRCHRELARHRFVNTTGSEVFHVTPELARQIAQKHVIAPGSIPWRLYLDRKAVASVVKILLGLLFLAAIAGHY